MKYINKNREPTKFTEWKALANDNWQPNYSNLPGDVKQMVKKSLSDEQGYICCYCERRLVENDSHIEHFVPQSDPDVDPLDFNNMLCSCQDRLNKGEPLHCGNRKGSWFTNSQLVSPTETGCEERFSFTFNGNIRPSSTTDTAALETIDRLGLDIPKITALRKSILEAFIDDSLTEDEVRQFVNAYLLKDGDGSFGEFWTMIRYLFRGYASA